MMARLWKKSWILLLLGLLYGYAQYRYTHFVTIWNASGDLLALRHLLFAAVFAKHWLVWLAAFALALLFLLLSKHPLVYSSLSTVSLLVLMLFLPSPLMKTYRVQNYAISTYDLMQSLAKDAREQGTIYLDCGKTGIKYLGEKEVDGLLYVSYTDGQGISTVFHAKCVPLPQEDTVKAFTIYKYSGIVSAVHT